MATFDLGKLKFNWRGAYADSTAYEVDDVVLHKNGAWVVTTAVASSNTTDPEANSSFDRMASGLFWRGAFATSTPYYLNDLVLFDNAIYIVDVTTVTATGSDTPATLTGQFDVFSAAPQNNVMTTVGDMTYRNTAGNNARLAINETVGKGLTVQKELTESYASKAFTYTENSGFGNVSNTTGSVPAASYTITTKAQGSDNYVVSGSDRNGAFDKKYERTIYINIGDTIVFNNTDTHSSHPMSIRVSNGGSSVSAGTYSGEGTATVTWVTTGVAAGTYFYQCQTHAGMVGQIIVQDITNTIGTSSANGAMNVTRGETYTITFDGLTNSVKYNIFKAAAPQTGAGNEISADEGNGTTGGTTYNGSAVTHTFTPNETTPNTVYIASQGNTNGMVTVNVHDPGYVPSWGTAAAGAAQGDNRKFKHWQDWYSADSANDATASSRGVLTVDDTRNPGSDVKVSGTAVGAQQRRVARVGGTTGSVNWTVPDGVEKVRITCVGAGGGGGSNNSHYKGGQGGGGGAFASGEFNVAAGEVLVITPGLGGNGNRATTGANGGTTAVVAATANGGSAHISVSAEGGTGGWYGNNGNAQPGNAAVVSGSDLVASTEIKTAGGRGGFGATTGAAWPHTGHVSGGGGSAGSMFGPGHAGGSATPSTAGGIAHSNCGGGGIGGPGGRGVTNYSPSDVGYASGGGGGGSAGPGQNGDGSGAVSPANSMNGTGNGGMGGRGLMPDMHEHDGWQQHEPHQVGLGGPNSSQHRDYIVSDSADTATDYDKYYYWQMCGGRYGDGEATSPKGNWAAANSVFNNKADYIGSTKQAHTINYSANAFNGVLGRLWGGGGGGANRVHMVNTYAGATGGCGGSGGGGGGAYGYNYYTTSQSSARGDGDNMTTWDPVNLAYRYDDDYCVKPQGANGKISTGTKFSVFCWGPSRANAPGAGNGGHGGALGGGGGACYGGGTGGNGGIGGGGGGASHRYSPSNLYGFGGHGGPGYVLIEWE